MPSTSPPLAGDEGTDPPPAEKGTPLNQIELASLGWDAARTTDFTGYAAEHVPARVTRVDRGACDALGQDGPMRLTFAGSLLSAAAADPVSTPCVGDWVAARS